MLAACGGGEGPTVSETQLDYSNAAVERHSYSPYETGSHIYGHRLSDEVAEVYIGGDLEPRESLRHIATQGDIRYFLGASRDGVGVDRLQNYANDLETSDGADPYNFERHGFKPFTEAPTLYHKPDLLLPENDDAYFALYTSVLIVNDALPPEFQIRWGGSRAGGTVYSGEILAAFGSSYGVQSVCGEGAAACAESTTLGDNTIISILYLPNDFDDSELSYAQSTIVHELLHALGISGHVDSIEFPDSIMGSYGGYFPNPGYVISKIDREVLQIMYMSQRTDLYNDWGEWSDTSFHVMGESEDGALRFGVALFNGLPQPWARGTLPDTALADNPLLFGTATWTGALLGFSGPSPIAGNAELEVDLSTLADDDNEQDLRFRDIYFVNRFESASEDRWFHTRDIDYKIRVGGYTFWNVYGEGYEEGHVTGAFMGPEHEHMGGTLKRTDMVAAFGGSR